MSSYTVTGFGTASANGTYNQAGTHGGLPYFQNGTMTVWYAGAFGYWMANVATLSDSDNSHNFYFAQNATGSENDLLGPWITDSLGTPPPGTWTLIASNQTTSITLLRT